MFDFDDLEEQEKDAAPSMTFYAISDCHIELKDNMQWLEKLPRVHSSTVIVAGDLGVNLGQIKTGLKLFKEKFDVVFYCYGNHETWVTAGDDEPANEPASPTSPKYVDSFEKLGCLRKICKDLGVHTTAQLIHGVWIVPVLGWYHDTWDKEGPLRAPPGEKLTRQPPDGKNIATDSHLCKWGGFENSTDDLAQLLDEQNEEWGIWPLPPELTKELRIPKAERKTKIISFSHFLPRQELMPEKRFLFQPNLIKIVGSDFVRKRVDQLSPDLHIFGHTHFPWDMTLQDGVRYRSWPLGTPAEQARRIVSYPTEHTEAWHPLRMFDSNGEHYDEGKDVCWFSEMYTTRKLKREPCSCCMADYVAEIYCPAAPRVPADIISPGMSKEPTSEADKERRKKYGHLSNASIKRNVQSGKNAAK